MKTIAIAIVSATILVAGRTAVQAQPAHTAENLKQAMWAPAPPLLPPGASIAILAGDPTKPAPYTVRLKFPAHYAIPAHWHPTDEHVVVTSGTLFFGMGNELDTTAITNVRLRPGGMFVAPADMNHYAFTRGAGATVVLYGQGPVEFHYVNPSDDPRNQPAASKRDTPPRP